MAEQLDAAARRQRVHDVMDRMHEALLAHDMMGFADLWAPDGVMEFPFAPPGHANLSGREEVREYVRSYADHVDLRSIRHQTRHETADPDVMIVEWGVGGTALATGRRYDIDYVGVIRVGEHGIVSYKDYWNPLAAGHALGSLPQIVEAVTGKKPVTAILTAQEQS
ncbi:nuclear transport factor 2 family protein [Streptomyces sp. KL118A]|uniref:nuclear transport factor 2 family protein n=1 Tax=Streptomyces sp. KL118A TaxID=3045153 RepID=UPI00278C8947|nr:nuclear transport factor 2 family protein [Streptomyces sp. KL118A]